MLRIGHQRVEDVNHENSGGPLQLANMVRDFLRCWCQFTAIKGSLWYSQRALCTLYEYTVRSDKVPDQFESDVISETYG